MAHNGRNRVVLKLSGRALGGVGRAFEVEQIERTVRQIKQAVTSVSNLELAITIGGGNILRGSELIKKMPSFDPAVAHYAGMVGTLANALILEHALESEGVECRLMSALPIKEVCEPFIFKRARRHLDNRRVLILAAGTGRPFFTTDTGAVNSAAALRAEGVYKATDVAGAFDCDPKKNPHARFLSRLSYRECRSLDLQILDMTAIDAASESRIPLHIFDFFGEVPEGEECNLVKALSGQEIGSIIS